MTSWRGKARRRNVRSWLRTRYQPSVPDMHDDDGAEAVIKGKAQLRAAFRERVECPEQSGACTPRRFAMCSTGNCR